MKKVTEEQTRKRNRVLASADMIVKAILDRRWTLEKHMELKSAILAIADAGKP